MIIEEQFARLQKAWKIIENTDTGHGGCWLWRGSKTRGGYGNISLRRGKNAYTHRVVYEALKGEIPEGYSIDHVCMVRACVNPAHLEAVPLRVNILRGNGRAGLNVRKTHCLKGHELAGKNLGIQWSKAGRPGRYCRECMRVRAAVAYEAWKQRQKAVA